VLSNRAHLLYRRRRYDEAMIDIRRSLELLPNDIGPLTLRARLHEAQGHPNAALADYTLAARLAPTDIYTHLRLAEYYTSALRRFDDALEALSPAESLKEHESNPSHYMVHNVWRKPLLRLTQRSLLNRMIGIPGHC
jgi:tetratricopeptide (TPR) repeat protein